MKVEVLIGRIFDHAHTYLSGRIDKLKPGSIVFVPFGRKKEIGVVWDKQEESNRKFKLKTILVIGSFSAINIAPRQIILAEEKIKPCLILFIRCSVSFFAARFENTGNKGSRSALEIRPNGACTKKVA